MDTGRNALIALTLVASALSVTAQDQADPQRPSLEQQRQEAATRRAEQRARFDAEQHANEEREREERTVDGRIRKAQQCLRFYDAVIAQQREVGREVGVVDNAALYNAGVQKIVCRKQLAQLQACKKTGGDCAQ